MEPNDIDEMVLSTYQLDDVNYKHEFHPNYVRSIVIPPLLKLYNDSNRCVLCSAPVNLFFYFWTSNFIL